MAEGMTVLVSLSALILAWVVFRQLIKTAMTLAVLVGILYLGYQHWDAIGPIVGPLFEQLRGQLNI